MMGITGGNYDDRWLAGWFNKNVIAKHLAS
jgi:hypothetical protein